jgi:cold shock CspA family protein
MSTVESSSVSTTSPVQTLPSKNLVTGCVKWFNNSLNYGFITVVTEGEHHNKDIFCHQSNIKTKQECFRTLYTGECVQFEITKSDNDKHPYHGVNISGFNGCMLHCENPYQVNRDNRRFDSPRDTRGRGGGGGSRGRGGSRGGGDGSRGGGDVSRKNDKNDNNETFRKR